VKLRLRYDSASSSWGKGETKDDDSGKKDSPATKKPKYEYNYKDSEAADQVRQSVKMSQKNVTVHHAQGLGSAGAWGGGQVVG
jgi:hypothetical protein